MANNIVKIGMIQMNVLFSEPDKNIQHASELVKSAKAKGAQICVLPECMDLGWGNPEASSLAEPVPGKVSDAYQKIAAENKVFLVAGLTEREQEKIYNTALLISDGGEILYKHRKINVLTGVEDVYAIGDRIGVTETPLGKIGIDICADNSLNSLSIAITLGRMCADMILSPCAWAVKSDYNIETEPYGEEWHIPYGKISKMFGIPVIGVSNVGQVSKGSWSGWKAIGNSIAYDSDGSLITVLPYGESEECVQVIDVHLTDKKVTGTALSEKIENEVCL